MKKKIKIVSIIGDRKRIIQDLAQKIKNMSIKENKPDVENKFESLKQYFKNDYEQSDVMYKNITNPTGKYLIYAKDTKHMQEIIEAAGELFGKINPNIKISSISEGTPIAKQNKTLKAFEEDKDKDSLKLLFLNSRTTKNINIENLDGAVVFYSINGTVKYKLQNLDRILNCLSDNSTLIECYDTIAAIELCPSAKRQLREHPDYDLEFDLHESYSNAETLREEIVSRKINDRFKLDLMKEYIETTKQEIKGDTVYKGYNIGNWKSCYRTEFLRGVLEIGDDLLVELEDIGLLGERKRRTHTTEEEKYNLLIDYYEKNPNDRFVKTTTIDDIGNPIGLYRSWLQVLVNRGKTTLTQEQLEKLKNIGYIFKTKDDITQLSEQYNISKTATNIISRQYGEIDDFIYSYKMGKINPNNLKLNKRGLLLSKSPLDSDKKQMYIRIITDMYGHNVLEDNSKFIILEELINAIENLPENRKKFFLERYKVEESEITTLEAIAQKFNYSRQNVQNHLDYSFKEILHSVHLYSIDNLKQKQIILQKELEETEDMSFEDWKLKQLDVDIKELNLTDLTVENMKKLGFSKVTDFLDISQKYFERHYGWTGKKIDDIFERVAILKKHISKEDKKKKEEEIKEKLETIQTYIDSYDNAFNYYRNFESIFPEIKETIPASIVTEVKETRQSNLSKKKEQKRQRKFQLDNINLEIEEQDEKSQRIKRILISSGIKIHNRHIPKERD